MYNNNGIAHLKALRAIFGETEVVSALHNNSRIKHLVIIKGLSSENEVSAMHDVIIKCDFE